jgi:hypothetical protein
MRILKLVVFSSLFLLLSCREFDNTSNNTSEANLIIKLKFDPTQERLGNLGQPVTVVSGIAAQSPSVNKMSAHYIEFTPTAFALLGEGEILFDDVLTITGDETEDIIVTLSFSTNNSFEWTEVNADGKYEPSSGEVLANMGLRGLIPIVTN